MPLDLFEVEGFGVWIAEDFTIQESLDSIKKILLQHHDCNLERYSGSEEQHSCIDRAE